ncbi:MAG: hypothetical protein KatS3mg010_1043 [Acidimicrobiia bacterium]|nr:MAG: hypothetical protein KatS3mg010_1043 [Acidimicrobiia bacterium]
MVTSGPAATNIVTPLCDAYMDSIPMVCITGQVPYAAIGTDAFQECDTVGITHAVTKHNWLVTERPDIPRIVPRPSTSPPPAVRARCWSTSPRTSSTQNPAMDWYWPETGATCPATGPHRRATRARSGRRPSSIMAARRPVIYAGGGILKARAAERCASWPS